MPVQRTSPVARSRPSNVSASSDVAVHSVPMSSRLTKKSLVSVPGASVNTPTVDSPALAPRTRRPPTSTVISGAVRVSRYALSTQQVLGRQP